MKKIIPLLFILLLTGCNEERYIKELTPDLLEEVLKNCHKNDGISSIYFDVRKTKDKVFYKVVCNDQHIKMIP